MIHLKHIKTLSCAGAAMCLAVGVSSATASAKRSMEYVQAKSPFPANGPSVLFALGPLDTPGITGGNGAGIRTDFSVAYAFKERFSLQLSMPTAGTASSGSDNYGIGNFQVQAIYLYPYNRNRFGIGVEASLPTATSRAAFGASMADITAFVPDQFAISPFLVWEHSQDQLRLLVDVGAHQQMFTSSAAGRGDYESILFYDIGVDYDLGNDWFFALEFNGYTPLSQQGLRSQFFGGPAIRYDDQRSSYAVFISAPFRSPADDVHHVMIGAQGRWSF